MTSRKTHIGRLLLALGFIVAAALAWRIESVSTQMIAARHAMAENPLAVAAARIAADDGDGLAHINGCFGCHGDNLTGRVLFQDWSGTEIIAPNLTRLAHEETDNQLAGAIRFGIKRDGTSVIGMPSSDFIRISDSDVAAMIAYLRTLPERPDGATKTLWGFWGRTLLAIGLFSPEAPMVDLSARGPRLTPQSPLARGHYITQSQCSICHGSDLSGETMVSSPDLYVSIKHYSPAVFAHFFKTGEARRGHGSKTMTKLIRSRFQYLTAKDVQALYVYLGAGRQPGE